jgi:hypothetical protein
MSNGRTACGQALAAFDPAAIVACLSDDVTIRVPRCTTSRCGARNRSVSC